MNTIINIFSVILLIWNLKLYKPTQHIYRHVIIYYFNMYAIHKDPLFNYDCPFLYNAIKYILFSQHTELIHWKERKKITNINEYATGEDFWYFITMVSGYNLISI